MSKDDLVSRLRDKSQHSAEAFGCEEYLPMATFWASYRDLSAEAAARIEALEAALREIRDGRDKDGMKSDFPAEIARAALSTKTEGGE